MSEDLVAHAPSTLASRPRVGILTFSEGREDFYARRRPLVDQECELVREQLGSVFEIEVFEPIRRKAHLRGALAELGEVDALIAHIPIFVEPALVAAVATLTQATVPLVLLGNRRPDTSSLVGLLGAGGALDQMGISHLRVWEDLAQTGVPRELVAYVRAARARRLLRGQTFGLFGGASLGIQTASSDPLQWLVEFGVEVKHVDQYMIVVEAERLPDDLVAHHRNWYEEMVGAVASDAPESNDWLDRQMRSYLATRKLTRDLDFDFISVKCQSELSDHYVLQCVSHSLLNDPYDADGPKEPLAASCEGDMDQALTMQLLKLVSGGAPSAALDVRLAEPDAGRFRMANCGSSPSSFAGLSADPAENLGEVHLEPHVFGRAGGYATQFVFAPSRVTMARLARRGGRYWLALFTGETVTEERERLRETTWPWPHAFIHADIDFTAFLAEFGSNHICAVRGDVGPELTAWARMANIEVRDFDLPTADPGSRT
jgi:L-fucose/D-arabinose isomerase